MIQSTARTPSTPACPSAGSTDLIFARFDGQVIDRGNHLLVRTPGNPTFWWGNFLLFQHAPGPGDLERWMALFDEEIATPQPASRHRAFGIDVRDRLALPPDFAAAGFALNEATVLTLTPRPVARRRPGRARGRRVPRAGLPRDSAAVVDKQVVVDAARFEPVGYREFAERQMARYAAMQRAGLGHWFGLVAHGRRPAGAGGVLRPVPRPGARRRPGPLPVRVDASRLAPARPVHRARPRRMPPRLRGHGPAHAGDGGRPRRRRDRRLRIAGLRRGVSTWQFERAPRQA